MRAREILRRHRRWLPGAAAAVAILLVTAAVLAVDPDNPSRLELFVGRLHPMLVHLPIGFLILALVLEALGRVPRYEAVRHALPPVLLLSAVGAVAAAVAGYQLAMDGGYTGETVTWHRRLGIGVAVGAVAVAALSFAAESLRRPWLRRAYAGALLLTVLMVGAAGHLGGSLTHGPDFLTEHLPAPLQSLVVLEDDSPPPFDRLDDAGAYRHLVQPVLQSRCVSCHGPDRQKGDLRLDSPEAILQGGEAGAAIVPGKPEESELIRRIWLPEGHEEHMPPRGRRPVTVAEAELLRWWIQRGAPFQRYVVELEPTPIVQAMLEEAAGDADLSLSPVLRQPVPPPDSAALAGARTAGLQVTPLADGTGYLRLRCRANQPCGPEQLRGLLPLAAQVTVLDLAGAEVGDAEMATVARLTRLTRLHLERTAVTDAGVAHLRALPHLEYLNLYGTRVGDAGIAHLAKLANLRSLHLWQTAVTPAGAAALRQQLPRARVELGIGRASMDSLLAAGARLSGPLSTDRSR